VNPTEPTRLSKNLERVAAKYHAPAYDDLFPDEVDTLDVRTPESYAAARWAASIPQRFNRATLDDFTDEAVRVPLTDWSASAGGTNLVLFGPTGTGKTHAAVAVCRLPHERGLSVEFAPAVEMFDRLRPGGPEDALDELIDVDRLIIDDLGAEKPTDWTAERLYLVVNRRWLDERPTIFTTNLDPKPLEVEVGARMFSRMVGSSALCIRMTGHDRRRKP
jgi:DNA replication protein DnaC